MKSLWWLVAGLGTAAALAQLARWRPHGIRLGATLDLNRSSHEDLLELPGIDEELAERILDNRPYRSKLDLLSRFVIPNRVYRDISMRVSVDARAAHDSIQFVS